jgi:uncharacterized membrane protein (DUF4010 family)
VSYSQRVRQHPALLRAAVTVILLASTVVYARVLLEVQAVAPALLPIAAGPIVVMALLTLVPALVLWWRVRHDPAGAAPEQDPPASLKGAIFFALLYVGVLVGLEAAQAWLGQRGLFAVAALSGLTDMDAVTLSSARMMSRGTIEAATAWRLIVTAAMANLAFKAGMAGMLGGRRLLLAIGGAFGLSFVGGAALIAFWPK